MDDEFRKSRAKRRKLEKKWKKLKTQESRAEFIEQRKICASMSVEKQRLFYSKVVEESGNDQRALFKVVNNLLDKQKIRVLPEHNDPKELADEFNHYYIDKVKKLRATIPTDSTGLERKRNLFVGVKMDKFDPVDEEELKKLISEFGVKTSTEDPLPAKFLSLVIDEALPCLIKLVNQSLE